VSRALHLISAS